MNSKCLVILGLGYSAKAIAHCAEAEGFGVIGTTRSIDTKEKLQRQGFNVTLYTGDEAAPPLRQALPKASHVLCSAPPILTAQACPLLAAIKPFFSANLKWLAYLSTIGVYGNQEGGWVDETTPPAPTSPRTRRRVETENAWLQAGETLGVPTAIFRLGGIYGPGRSPLDRVRAGTARRIIKPGQVFNRIHVADIADAVTTAALTCASGIYNSADDEPAPPQTVVEFASDLLHLAPPPEVPFDSAELSPMARSFYSDNKRIRNEKFKSLLGGKLRFPSYREGLTAILQQEQAAPTSGL